jgi:hypothetical protein
MKRGSQSLRSDGVAACFGMNTGPSTNQPVQRTETRILAKDVSQREYGRYTDTYKSSVFSHQGYGPVEKPQARP